MHNNSDCSNFWNLYTSEANDMPILDDPVQSQAYLSEFQSLAPPQPSSLPCMPMAVHAAHEPMVMDDTASFPGQPPPLISAQASATDTPIFRRRRNWTERILNEITGLLHVLSPLGKILYCSGSTVQLTGYTPDELVGKPITDYLHIDDIDVFARDFHRAFAMQYKIQMIYRFRKKDDDYVILETVGHFGMGTVSPTSMAFFAVSQAYPSSMNSVLDSFLELKMENDWLKQRLQEVTSVSERRKSTQSEPPSNNTTPESHRRHRRLANTHDAAKRLSVRDSHISEAPQTVGLMTPKVDTAWLDMKDLTCVDLDRLTFPPPKQPLRTGVLPQEGLVTALPDTVDPFRKDKWKRRRRQKSVDEYVCTDCGTTASPEWRKGPQGPKTLCNACGLRWAKKIKKDSNAD